MELKIKALFFIFLAPSSLIIAGDSYATDNVIEHTVVKGDTLWDISNKYYKTPLNYDAIKKNNNIKYDKLLKQGQQLKLISAAFYPAVVTSIEGDAILLTGDEKINIQQGSLVNKGDLLQVNDSSFVMLKFINQVEVEVQPKSLVIFGGDTVSNSLNITPSLRLKQGSIEIKVPPEEKLINKLEVMSANLILGVRGTNFRVKNDTKITRSELLDGQIILYKNNNKQLSLDWGKGVIYTHDKNDLVVSELNDKPVISNIHYDGNGTSIYIGRTPIETEHKIKVYRDKEYLQPVYEDKNKQGYFYLKNNLTNSEDVYFKLTSFSSNGLESFPLYGHYTKPKIKLSVQENSVRFIFPYCNTSRRLQISETETFVISAIDKSEIYACELLINNLPDKKWYWRVYEGKSNNPEFDSGNFTISSKY